MEYIKDGQASRTCFSSSKSRRDAACSCFNSSCLIDNFECQCIHIDRISGADAGSSRIDISSSALHIPENQSS